MTFVLLRLIRPQLAQSGSDIAEVMELMFELAKMRHQRDNDCCHGFHPEVTYVTCASDQVTSSRIVLEQDHALRG